MIDQIDGRLDQWVRSVVSVEEVSLASPAAPKSGSRIDLYLFEVAARRPPRGLRRPPLQLSLRYLVTAWAERPEMEHRLLGDLVLAAMEHPEFEVQLDPVPAGTWTAFGLPPRPSFILQVLLQHERPQPAAPPVRVPLAVRMAQTKSVNGLVLGPGNIPVMGAEVELPSLRRSTRTDAHGRFRFPAVPAKPFIRTLRVRARGQEVEVTTEQAPGAREGVVVHMQFGSSSGTEA